MKAPIVAVPHLVECLPQFWDCIVQLQKQLPGVLIDQDLQAIKIKIKQTYSALCWQAPCRYLPHFALKLP
jgi:hypothetical protein